MQGIADAKAVHEALAAVRDPSSGAPRFGATAIEGLVIRPDGQIGFALVVPGSDAAQAEALRQAAIAAVEQLPGVTKVTVVATARAAPARAQTVRLIKGDGDAASARETARAPVRAAPPPGVKAIIAVASAKGGVGKSTVAVNLACAFARMGLKTGLLDADVHGPSVPIMVGLVGADPRTGGDRLTPPEAHGLRVMSMGFMVDADAPMIWRGPIVTSAIRQMLADVDWSRGGGDPLDVLVLDMPPGTGEVQLTVAQSVPLAGAVIVSTPQDVALADVRRGIAMFEKVACPILGIVENMAWFEESNGHRVHPFGEGGARRTAAAFGAPFLGALPIDPELARACDAGVPLVLSDPESLTARLMTAIAEAALANMAAAARPAPVIRFE
jgi:ATP-binding protein involved in chromosome partitioning